MNIGNLQVYKIDFYYQLLSYFFELRRLSFFKNITSDDLNSYLSPISAIEFPSVTNFS